MERPLSSAEAEIGRINALAARDSYRPPRIHPYIAETLRQYVKSYLLGTNTGTDLESEIRIGRAGLTDYSPLISNNGATLPMGTPYVRLIVSSRESMRLAHTIFGPISRMDEANWALDWYRPTDNSPNYAINIYPSVEDALEHFAETETQ